MANADPFPSPDLLDPLLDYLATVLPPPADRLVDIVIAPLVARACALGGSLYALMHYLLSTSPGAWDTQLVLPPLITLAASYLALISFYRTTGWMLRTSFWFAKWGTIIATLAGGAGFFAGQGGGAGLDLHGGLAGLARGVGDILWDALNAPNAADQPAGRRRSSRRRAKKAAAGAGAGTGAADKPGAWDSFDKHRAYRAQQAMHVDEDGDEEDAPLVDGKKLMTQIVGFAGKMGWLDTMKDAVETVAKDLASKAAEEAKASASGEGESKSRKKAAGTR